MRSKVFLFHLLVFTLFCGRLFGQTHTSVPLDNQVYSILEQAQMRGLISPLSGVRPYTRSVVVGAVNELLAPGNYGRLKDSERQILEDVLAGFETPQSGLDWKRGGFYSQTELGKNGMPLSFNLETGVDFELSSAFIPEFGETYLGTELWAHVDLSGDIGRNISYGLYNQGGLVKMPRSFLGTYNTYYYGFSAQGGWDPNEFQNRVIDVYSGPVTQFPFSYRKRWDGSIFTFDSLSSFKYWPESFAGGYAMQGELTASFLENRLIIRTGRMPREWGSGPLGTSLIFSSAARPFLAAEAEFRPFSWFSISSLTGILEYENVEGIKVSSMTSQNAFSATMVQLSLKDYLFFDIVDAVVYPKRFELGYMLPITSSFFYQNNIGDFDNMSLAFNLKAQYPGLGNVWFSLFLDEMSLQSNMTNLDRTMVAYQGGFNIPLPVMSFSSLRFSYTKINPYTYTHNRNINPWFGDLPMETSWTNNGVGLGSYLPPNSDEFLLQFKTMPAKNLSAVFEYQMIRHGASHGSSAVDGSNLLSELDPGGRGGDPVLWRFFLRDGAYQWMHVVKAGGDWKIPRTPVSLFGEAGVVFSYYTNINVPANNAGLANGETPHPSPFRRINTPEYPVATSLIAKIGFRLFL